MPAGDGTGPMGQGPMTGRGAGYCAGDDVPGYAYGAPGWGRGLGWGRGWWGRGRGWRCGPGRAWGPPPAAYPPHGAPPTSGQEVEYLRSQAQWLKDQLDVIHRRIDELEPEM